jgi:hypothetical protein
MSSESPREPAASADSTDSATAPVQHGAGEPAEAERLRALREWVAGKARDLPPGGLTDDLPLLEGRHLTSLHIPELILLLERLRRAPIDVERLQAGDFHSIRTIADRFLAAAGSAPKGPHE